MERRLFIAQRLSALALAPMVIIHLAVILIAVKNGLTAAEILGRTQGNWLWAAFYGLFVVAAAIHAPIGLRNILREWTDASARAANGISAIFGVALLLLGLRAVWAVVG